VLTTVCGLLACVSSVIGADNRPPNIVVIFIDDMGYGDIGPFGATDYATPNLDRMADEGMRFTDFVASSAVCSASRAALLTGSYHLRVGITGALGPDARIGINEEETTLGEICRSRGYATACFGKWHLGHHPKFLPTAHGFDEYFGLPYSNDMWPYHPNNLRRLADNPDAKPIYPPLPLIEGTTVIEPAVTADQQAELTARYTQRAVDFIQRHQDQPFLVYLPHTMVHVPIYASKRFEGKSGAGLYGDVVMEIDWSVGAILDCLRRLELDDDTLVIFTSDNGPWLSYGDHAGTAGPLREGKGTMFEGGYREPTVMRWPGKIPPGTTCDELASTIDILPTVARLIGAELPQQKIDGKDIGPLMFAQPGAQSPHDAFWCYYGGGQLQAIRDRRWKLHFPHSYRTLSGRQGGTGGQPVDYDSAEIGMALFDLKSDPGETMDVANMHPEIVDRLKKLADMARNELGDRLRNQQGKENRAPGRMTAEDAVLIE
jgi:arylsulfatase A-like enzyme